MDRPNQNPERRVSPRVATSVYNWDARKSKRQGTEASNVAQHESTKSTSSSTFRHQQYVIDEYRCVPVNDNGSGWVYAVAFQPDGEHILGGGSENDTRRWRLADGQEVGKQTGMRVTAISVSRDHRWIVCGTFNGVNVWDGDMQEKVIDVEGTNKVWAVDISPDSTRFATGTSRKDASIWSITSGKRLVGPLTHDTEVNGIRFSPTGEHVATACWSNSVRIFNSRTGDKLVTIGTDIPGWGPATPLAWSSDAQQIFSACRDNKIRAFDTSTGSLLAQSKSLRDGSSNDIAPIAVAVNGKFIAAFAEHSISFLDTSTLARIGPVIEDGIRLGSIAISADSSHLATGRADGKIMIRDLSKILPASYGPFHVPAHEEARQDEQSSRSDGHDEQLPDPTPGDSPGKSSPLQSGGHNDLIELEVPSSAPAQFDFDESLSLASSAPGDEIPSIGSSCHSHVASQLPDIPPATSPPEARVQEDLDTVVPPRSLSIIFKRWLRRKGNKDPTSHEPKRLSGKSRRPGNGQSPSRLPSGADATNEGPSWMAAGKRKRRAVAKTVRRPQDKSSAKTTVPKPPNKNALRNGHVSVSANETGPPQQESNPSQPSAGTVHVTHQQETGVSTLSISFPTWMWCCRSPVTQDGTH